MKVYYNSKLAKILTFMRGFGTMMFFGVIITEYNNLNKQSLIHEKTHISQYEDCVELGCTFSILLGTLLVFCDIFSWWLLLLCLIPVFLYYVLYGAEYVYWRMKGLNKIDAYREISFEKQARYIADTWDLPSEYQNHYESFGWWDML